MSKEDAQKNHIPLQTIIMTVLFAAFGIALGFLWAGSAFGRIISIVILSIFGISTAIALVLFFTKQKQTAEAEEEKLQKHRRNMRAITTDVIAQGSLSSLHDLDQRVLNHYVAFVMSQWGYRADVPAKATEHEVDVWLYKDARQFATVVSRGTEDTTQTSLIEFSNRYLTRPHILGVYITLGGISPDARAWAQQNNPSLWLVDSDALLQIIQRTNRGIVAWNAGPMAPLPQQ